MAWRLSATIFVYWLLAAPAAAQSPSPARGPTASEWLAIASLPDWSGIWVPDQRDQIAQINSNPPPWTEKVAKEVAFQSAEMAAGRPADLFVDCLPLGMPSWMLVNHNALEFLFSPGRVTMLGEGDGNRLRRIHTDGRTHDPDLEPSFHGDSVGRWEGDTLVIDTVGVLPQTWLAIDEGIGIPNDGGMRISERIRIVRPDVMHVDLTIVAPQILSKPWDTTRIYSRRRGRVNEILEGVCLQGSFRPSLSPEGHHIYAPIPMLKGNPVPLPH